MTRINTRNPYTVVPDETEDMDDVDIAAVNGEGYDAGNPNDWPEDVRDAARKHWEDGPEAFAEWSRTFQ
jgi:hypothetical protein